MTEAIAHPTQVSATGNGKFAGFSLTGISLAKVNVVLAVLTVLTVIYFLLTLLVGAVRLAGVGHHIRSIEAKGAQAAREPKQPEAPVTVKTDPGLSNRNIFLPAGAGPAATAAVSANAAGAYRLVGISQSKDPADTYVMVENSQTKLTYFLQYGQLVEGLELERILEDKVIVKIGGKSVELE